MCEVRVRFAPSPTGELHIGGVRTALFNWLFARNQGGKFVLRIDDTDKQRSTEEYLQSILSSFQWLELDWDEGPGAGGNFGPYRQSERLDIYRKEAEKLLTQGKAYICFCTAEELDAERDRCRKQGQPPRYSGRCRNLTAAEVAAKKENGQDYVIRAVIPDEGETVVDDLIRGRVTFDNKVLDDLIIVKSDGLPTYNFASVVDDYHMNITHVIRAEEHLSNTPRQQVIARQLGYTIPRYAHVPMILAPDHSKLSKRHGATSVKEYQELGILPEALLNYLVLLGWSPGQDKEIMSMEEIIELFSLERVSKNPAIYDLQKLVWLNSHYLRTGERERIVSLAVPFLQKHGFISAGQALQEQEKIGAIVEIVREKVKTLDEIAEASDYFFLDEFEYDQKAVAKHFNNEQSHLLIKQIRSVLEKVEPFNAEEIGQALTGLSKKLGVPLRKINPATRLALTGRLVGPDLFPLISLLGKQKGMERLEKVSELFFG